MAWNTLLNSTTADATVVNANFYWVRQGTLLPLGAATMEATTSVYDIGSVANKWRDGHFSGSVTAKGITAENIGGAAADHRYLEFRSDPISSSITLVNVPPFKSMQGGRMYIAAATQTLLYDTASSWIDGANHHTGLTSTFAWIYAKPTTTGDAVAYMDIEQPVTIWNTVTAGLYHPSTTNYPNARAVHVVRYDSANSICPYLRKGNKIEYWNAGNIFGFDPKGVSTTADTFTMVFIPALEEIEEMFLTIDYDNAEIIYVNHPYISILAAYFELPSGDTSSLVTNGNLKNNIILRSGAAKVTAQTRGYTLKW